MTVEEGLSIVEVLLGASLNDLQEEIFRLSWEQKTYPEIAEISGYDADYIKVAGFKLWKKLSEVTGEKVTKDNLRSVLRRWQNTRDREQLSFPSHISPLSPHQDWGEAVDTSIFYGRSHEIEILEKWIVEERCRLVALLGIGGIGKTSLSVKLAEKLSNAFILDKEKSFEFIIWRSLQNAPPIDSLLTSLILFISHQQENQLSVSVSEKNSVLISYLQKHRCLIILDNLEAILTSSESGRAGYYREGYESYGELFKRVGEFRHQSCLVITSREKPKEVALLEGEHLPVRSLQLSGLEITDAQAILNTKGNFYGAESDWYNLINSYAGNPLALKIVATTIRDLFDSKIYDFLCHGTVIFGDIQDLIEQQFNRLSSLEKDVMYWLAINREPVDFAELQFDLLSSTPNHRLLEALQGLERRCLIEVSKNTSNAIGKQSFSTFTLQPVLMEFMISRLIQQVCTEIETQNIFIFKNHAIIKASAKDYIKDIQIYLILNPIITQLLSIFGSINKIEIRLQQIISSLRGLQRIHTGYAVGNSINILRQLQVNLNGYDFSDLTIWQADLKGTDLHQTNFAYSDLTKSTFTANLSFAFAIAISPDSSILATGDTHGRIGLWQIANGQQIFSWLAHTGWIRSIIFSADGNTLFSCSDDRTVKQWNLQGECLKTFQGHIGFVWSIALAYPLLASGGNVEQVIKVWNIETGECLKSLQGHSDWICSIALTSDGQIIASASQDSTIKLWDVSNGKLQKTLERHLDTVWSVAFTKNDLTVVSASADKTVKVWDVKTGQCLSTLHGHTARIWRLACSPNGKLIATVSDDKTIKLWDIDTGECLKTLQGHSNSIYSLAFSADGQSLIASDSDRTIKFWHIPTGQCTKTLCGYGGGIWSIDLFVFKESSKPVLASGNEDQTVKLWDIKTGQCIKTFKGHTHWIRTLVFSPDGKTLASGSADETVRIWDVQTGKCLHILKGHTNWALALAYSPDGKTLASGGSDQDVRVWGTSTGECLHLFEREGTVMTSVAYSPDGKFLIGSGANFSIRVWNVHTGKCVKNLEAHTHGIWAVKFSPDGHYLASCSEDTTIKIWSFNFDKTDAYIECIRTLTGHTQGIICIAYSSDGRLLASGSSDQTIRIWDVETGECLQVLSGHTRWVYGVIFTTAFSELSTSENPLVVSCSEDETIRIWNINAGECIKVLRSSKPYEGMNITGVRGLTEAQKATLLALGALVED